MKFHCLLMALICSTGCISSPAAKDSFRGPAQFSDEKARIKAVEAVVKELQGAVQSLDTPVTIYHYWNRHNETGALAVYDSPVQAYAGKVIDSFFDLSAVGQTYVSGFYGAIDPYISSSYGGDNFGLMLIRLQKGIRVLKLNEGQWKNPETAKLLEDADCEGQSSEYFPIEVIMKSIYCRKIAIDAVKQLKVDVIQYPWVAADLHGCDPGEKSAFVVLNKAVLGEKNVEVFSKEIPTPDRWATDRALITQLGRSDFVTTTKDLPYKDLWPQLHIDQKPIRDWAAANLLACH